MGRRSTIAVLDIDGTLLPGALGIELLQGLRRANVCDPDAAEAVLRVLDAFGRGELDFRSMATRAYAHYADALRGRDCGVVEAVAGETWARRRPHLFAFVPELLDCLRAHGYQPMLISGSPAEMVRLVAEDLGIADAHGAVFGRQSGVYTGTVERASGVPGHKARIFTEATLGRSLGRCFALGDSFTDVAMFERVSLPLVFEPGPVLEAIAAERGWSIATASDVVARTRLLIVGAASARIPEQGALRC